MAPSVISVGVPMPSLTDGARPKSRTLVLSIVEALPHWNMPLTRAALFSPNGVLTSAVVRMRPLVVTWPLSSVACFSPGFLVTWLMTPPVEPRPNSIEDGPIRTSIASSANVSR